MNLERLKLLLNNDDKLVKRFIGIFIRETPKQLSTLRTAIETKNLHEVALVAHALKSQLKYMGSDQLATVAERLEKDAENRLNPDKLNEYYRKLHHGINRIINSF